MVSSAFMAFSVSGSKKNPMNKSDQFTFDEQKWCDGPIEILVIDAQFSAAYFVHPTAVITFLRYDDTKSRIFRCVLTVSSVGG